MAEPTPNGSPAMSPFAALTPYPIPAALHGKKVQNLGDGFILRAIERRLGPFAADRTFSPRVPLPPGALAVLQQSPAVILAGANQLHDRYTGWPGFDAAQLRASSLRLVPFGIGLHGDAGFNDAMTVPTRALLLAMHERIAFSSWRCPDTIAYLQREVPQLAPQLLMTGCPVVYDEPLLAGTAFTTAADRIAVTVTERHDFWARETAVLDFVARRFPRARRFLVLHQNWSPPTRLELLRHRWLPQPAARLNDYQRLRQFAVQRGFQVVCPPDALACITFYGGIDLHIGSRLHAHLLFLSRSKRSWLVPVDGRAIGMAKALGFPLCAPQQLEAAMDFDFETVRTNARTGYGEMVRFLASLPR